MVDDRPLMDALLPCQCHGNISDTITCAAFQLHSKHHLGFLIESLNFHALQNRLKFSCILFIVKKVSILKLMVQLLAYLWLIFPLCMLASLCHVCLEWAYRHAQKCHVLVHMRSIECFALFHHFCPLVYRVRHQPMCRSVRSKWPSKFVIHWIYFCIEYSKRTNE